ncbi:M48 family metalloprotease [Nibribacter ruber]|uniref:M48 family metalloprotease n=1 Tax=Nibribacter ruber TaxID=2698458 RepID=A0A6P1P442_9BACT|nr:M48 family metalloprotease [Nibribacter ruber]QHL89106.1 M48 family metalloprotease [Nibribacter ruber]
MKKVLLTVLTSVLLTAGAAVSNPSVAEAKEGSAAQYTTQAGARDIITEIIDAIGLKPRFEVRAANVPNAAATIINGKRYILYNEQFLSAVNNAVRTDWAGVSILAHEIGHHLNGHTLTQGGSNINDELEADEFSGFVLRKMGASLSETQAAIKVLADDEDNRTHPGKSSRLAAINRGWRNAENQILASAKAGTPTRTVAAPARSSAMASAAPAATARRASASRMNSQYILRQVKLQGAPQERIYVTTAYNVVRETEDGLQVIGKMQKTNSRNFPYVLESQYLPNIFVTTDGLLLNEDGQRVGVLTT